MKGGPWWILILFLKTNRGGRGVQVWRWGAGGTRDTPFPTSAPKAASPEAAGHLPSAPASKPTEADVVCMTASRARGTTDSFRAV
jgi:hypothetical protein